MLTRSTATTPGADARTDIAYGEPDGTLEDGATVSGVATPGSRPTTKGAAQCRVQPGGLTTWTVAVAGAGPGSTSSSLVVTVEALAPTGRYMLVDADGEAGRSESTGALVVERSRPKTTTLPSGVLPLPLRVVTLAVIGAWLGATACAASAANWWGSKRMPL